MLQGTTLELFPSVAWLLGSNNCVALNSSKPNYDLISPTSQLLVLLYIETESDKATKEFDRLSLISEDILRHLIVNIGE